MPTTNYHPNESGASAAVNPDALKYNPIRRTPGNLPPVPAVPQTAAAANVGQNASIQAITQNVQATSHWVRPLQDEIGRVIVGQNYLITRLLVGLLATGPLFLKGVPVLPKTLSLPPRAGAIQAKFQRIQFPPDMLPADIVGTLIY